MPTTVTHSIGTTGRDYATIQLWADACPADLTASDQIWRGECYNDTEFHSTTGTILTFAATTTDATRYIILTAAAGQSFQDNAGVRTNPLTYDASKGVGLRVDTSFSGSCILAPIANFHVTRLQLKCDTFGVPINFTGHAASVVDSCFIVNTITDQGICEGGSNSLVTNCVVYIDTANTSGTGLDRPIGLFYTSTIIGCSVVRNPAYGAGSTAISGASSCLVKSTAIFGFTTTIVNPSGSCTNNATDQATLPGSGGQTSVTFSSTSPFVQADSSSGLDLRAKSGTVMDGNGFLDGTNAPNDISKTARANPPTIGAWELTGGGGGGGGHTALTLVGVG